MAVTNHERIGKALELLKTGLGPFVEREMKSIYTERLETGGRRLWERIGCSRINPCQWDVAALLKLMWDAWNSVFRERPSVRRNEAW